MAVVAPLLTVDVTSDAGVLRIAIRDDGIGGADPAKGSGLVGLRDRIETLGGTISVRSPKGEGTTADVAVPLDADHRTAGHLHGAVHT